MSTVPFRAPTGVPDEPAPKSSLIGQLRALAKEKHDNDTLVMDLPGRWEGKLRVRYGYLALDEMEKLENLDLSHVSQIGVTLDLLSKAMRAIEAYDAEEETWQVLRDELGPVSFDDRLTRLLDWPRPDEDWEFSVRQVYEGMFDGNGLLIGTHVGQVAEWMGLALEEEELGKASANTGSMPSEQQPPSG